MDDKEKRDTIDKIIESVDKSGLERHFQRQCIVCNSLGFKKMLKILKEKVLKEEMKIVIVEAQRPD